MAQVLEGGGTALFNALAYGDPHPATQQFLQSQVEAPSHTLTEAGRQFVEGARGIYEALASSQALRMARAARRAVGSIWQSNEIRSLTAREDFQSAPLEMQRWVMAEPKVRKMYHQQRLEGYEGSYRDPFPEDVGEEHYDYRRVMNGLVVETDDGWRATTYLDELLPEERELDLEEQVDIVHSWEWIRDHIRQGGEDPTSRWGAEL